LSDDRLEKVRVVYIRSRFFEALMQKALKRYGFRTTLAKALGYSSPNALNHNTEKNGILAKRFLKLCDVADVKFEEVRPHIVAIVLYGNRRKQKLPLSEEVFASGSIEVKMLNSLFGYKS